jgi:uncharacterized damage-inducible protein DinB
MSTPQHRADLFIDPVDDPRMGGPSLGGERATLCEFLRGQRLTLEIKCADLDAEQLARRSVEPSTLSLLGLVRHMAEVERTWFRTRFAGQHEGKRYQHPDDPDGDFNGAVADDEVVKEAWAAWREEIAFADEFIDDHDFDFVGDDGRGDPITLRELIVHMIEEYARHNGHADLIRERIDGRVGQLPEKDPDLTVVADRLPRAADLGRRDYAQQGRERLPGDELRVRANRVARRPVGPDHQRDPVRDVQPRVAPSLLHDPDHVARGAFSGQLGRHPRVDRDEPAGPARQCHRRVRVRSRQLQLVLAGGQRHPAGRHRIAVRRPVARLHRADDLLHLLDKPWPEHPRVDGERARAE